MAKLPDTYEEFIKDWNEKFPLTFDNKVLAHNCKVFFKTVLGELFEKVTNDDRFKKNLQFKFDLKNGFVNYEGTGMLSHYHEAAYDAHMTGVVFGHILKFIEISYAKHTNESKEDKKKGEKSKGKQNGPSAETK